MRFNQDTYYRMSLRPDAKERGIWNGWEGTVITAWNRLMDGKMNKADRAGLHAANAIKEHQNIGYRIIECNGIEFVKLNEGS